MDSYLPSMQMGNTGYHTNTDHSTLPKWGHNNDGGSMVNNSTSARVVEVASPDLQTNERVRRPSGNVVQGRPGYPSATNPPRMYDRRRYACMYVCVYICMYTCMYIRTYVHMYVCMYACTSVHIYVCIYTYVHACVCVCVC